MYSKEESTKLKQQFWISFGKYMKPVPSANGQTINWINYKTGIKNIFFRTNAERDKVSIAVVLAHTDNIIRQIYFEQFKSVKKLLHEYLNEEWEWTEDVFQDGAMVSTISAELKGRHVLNIQDWPDIISFLKSRLIALDAFWTDVKMLFESLG